MDKTKNEIRKFIIDKRDSIDITVKNQMDQIIFHNFINSDFYRKAKVIFTFVNFASEVDTKQIIEYAINDNKTICVPRVISKEKGIDVHKINGIQDLEAGFYGILEPKEKCEKIDAEKIDFIIMPGVAFDRQGNRIGYGGGFYDRFLRNIKKEVNKIAIAYHFQLIDEVPYDELDVPIDGIITDKETIIF